MTQILEHRFVDQFDRNLCDYCEKWKGHKSHISSRNEVPESEEYERGYLAGYEAGVQAAAVDNDVNSRA